MTNRNSTVEIKDGKVVFSQEIINYFESLRNEETSEWIDKYFEYLSYEENLNAKKFRIHHIIPCFMFKDETHKTRTETEPLANKVKGNEIKLSIENHIISHYCLWKIFYNKDAKKAIQHLCKMENLDDLTEEKLNEIAKIQEECAKKNQTKEERAIVNKTWYENNKNTNDYITKKKQRYEKNKDKYLKKNKDWYHKNKDDVLKQQKDYYEKHKDGLNAWMRNYYLENKDKYLEYGKFWDSQICEDPIKGEICSYVALKSRKYRNKEEYKNVILKDCIIKD